MTSTTVASTFGSAAQSFLNSTWNFSKPAFASLSIVLKMLMFISPLLLLTSSL